RCEARALSQQRARAAIVLGEKDYFKPVEPPPARLVSPAAVVSASGPAFPLGQNNANPPDPQYAADRAIDGNADTFCCLSDDSPDGDLATTIPARAAVPVTGHVIFDLGRPLPIHGARLVARASGGTYNPRRVDFFYFANSDPQDTIAADDLDDDPHLKPLLTGHAYSALRNGASQDFFWDGVVTRYVGIRVRSSYESRGPVYYNFQIAEMQFFTETANIVSLDRVRADAK
ncbi:MAG: hypothetical protein HQ582_34290, partial [Planctomycetes bacterium]|nr:hypothetical protein [Planctomycetota bacterium]